jgi:3-oxoacyl-[acyl-carrier protein] reductase
MFPEAAAWRAEQLRVGLRAEFERDITDEDVLAFARQSGDCNPLHVDRAFARDSAFQGRIVHGAFQVSLASALLGMHLPGRHVLLGSVHARFPSPLYFPCRVCVRGEITSWDANLRAGQVRVTVLEASLRNCTAEIVLGFTLREPHGPTRPAPVADAPARAPTAADRLDAVLVTGASGGIGAALVRDLASRYRVLGMVNRHPLEEALLTLPNVVPLSADLGDPTWEERAAELLGDRPLFAVVHAAWPGAPRGGLLQCPDDQLEQQLCFGTTHLVRLARFLFARVGGNGGRLIALGSVVGSARPALTLASYSLGKASLESTVRLLAPELARKQVTVNALCPSFLSVGINKHADERQQKLEASRIPLGRLCTPADVLGGVSYLLSPAASFVSGQVLGLSGGQL